MMFPTRFIFRRLRDAACAASIAAILFATCVFAAAAPAKPKPIPVVTVKKNDGSMVRGQLVMADGAKLSVKPMQGKEFGEPVDVAWADVKTVSNGLTREKAWKLWKVDHKDQLCEACDGELLVDCEICHGTGHDPESSKDCKSCKGEMRVDCTQKKCEDGKIPCPAPCLKPTDAGWSKPDANGVRWLIRRGRGGVTARVSNGHIGETITNAKGEITSPTTCDVCKKATTVQCPTCQGSSKLTCPTCKANKKAADCATCEDGKVDCKTCYKTGLKNAQPPAVVETPVVPDAPAPAPAAPGPATPAPAAPAPATPAKPGAAEDGF